MATATMQPPVFRSLPLFTMSSRALTPDKIQRQFEKFHHNNPGVYSRLVALARQLKAANVTRYGIGSLFEVLRWERSLKKAKGERFLLNNNYRSRYVRLIERQEPDLKGFFETRKLTAMVGR